VSPAWRKKRGPTPPGSRQKRRCDREQARFTCRRPSLHPGSHHRSLLHTRADAAAACRCFTLCDWGRRLRAGGVTGSGSERERDTGGSGGRAGGGWGVRVLHFDEGSGGGAACSGRGEGGEKKVWDPRKVSGHISLHTVPPIPLLEILVHLSTAWMDRVS
jgi:hypothetical protein